MNLRDTFGLLALLSLLSPSGVAADADAGWLRLERFNDAQRGELETGQRQYSKSVQQRQRSLQDKQLREASFLRQRQRVAPDFERNNRRQLKLQRSQRQQWGLQNRLQQQRRSWRYGR